MQVCREPDWGAPPVSAPQTGRPRSDRCRPWRGVRELDLRIPGKFRGVLRRKKNGRPLNLCRKRTAPRRVRGNSRRPRGPCIPGFNGDTGWLMQMACHGDADSYQGRSGACPLFSPSQRIRMRLRASRGDTQPRPLDPSPVLHPKIGAISPRIFAIVRDVVERDPELGGLGVADLVDCVPHDRRHM